MVFHANKYAKVRKQKSWFGIGDIIRILLKRNRVFIGVIIYKDCTKDFLLIQFTSLKFPRYTIKDEHMNIINDNLLEYKLLKVDLSQYRAVIINSRVRKGVKQILHRFNGYKPAFDLWLSLDESAPKHF